MKSYVLNKLAELANKLDKKGLYSEAAEADGILKELIAKKKDKGPKKPPKKYRESGATKRSDYADPDNYKYPIDTEAHVRAALSYFSKPANANKYSKSEQSKIWARIRAAAKRYGISLSEKAGPPSQEKKKK